MKEALQIVDIIMIMKHLLLKVKTKKKRKIFVSQWQKLRKSYQAL